MTTMEHSPYTTESERFAISYLDRYEAMIQAQDEEDQATISHLRPIFQIVQRLGGGRNSDSDVANTTYPHPLSAQDNQQLSLVQDTSFTANHEDTFLNATGKGNKPLTRDSGGNVLIMKTSNVSSAVLNDRVSYQTIRCFIEKPVLLSISDAKDYEVLQTDEQLCMVLEKIAEDYPMSGESSGTALDLDDESTFGISFAEFVHVYKTAVSGMQALQMLPEKDTVSGYERERTKKRTLQMIRSFSKLNGMSFVNVNESNTSIISDDNILSTSIKNDKPRMVSSNGDGFEDFNNDVTTAIIDDDDDDDDEDYDEVVDDTTKKEAMISNEFLQREIKLLAMARETSEHIEILNERIRQGKMKLIMTSILCLFLCIAGGGCFIKYQMDHEPIARGSPLTAEQAPVVVMTNNDCPSNSGNETSVALKETKEKLEFALNELGAMVLTMSKKEEELSRCLTENVPCEASIKCEPCNKFETMSDSLTFQDEVNSNPKLKSLVLRRQVFAAVGAAILTSLPALLSTQGILRKILSLVRLIKV